MLACGCSRRQGLGANALTVTAACPLTYTDVSDPNNPKVTQVSAIAHALCVAEHNLTTWAVDAWHWTWAKLEVLWQWLGTVTKEGIADLQAAVNDFLHCVDCMDPTASADEKQKCGSCPRIGTPEWMRDLGILAVLIGGAYLLHEFSPAINDSVHYYTRKSRA
jgi:hypothetical protein